MTHCLVAGPPLRIEIAGGCPEFMSGVVVSKRFKRISKA
jgi:hypothetical protein